MRSGFNLWTGTLSNAKGSLSWDGKLRNKTSKDLERDMAGNINRTPWQAYFFLDFLWVFFLSSIFFQHVCVERDVQKKKKQGRKQRQEQVSTSLGKKRKHEMYYKNRNLLQHLKLAQKTSNGTTDLQSFFLLFLEVEVPSLLLLALFTLLSDHRPTQTHAYLARQTPFLCFSFIYMCVCVKANLFTSPCKYSNLGE